MVKSMERISILWPIEILTPVIFPTINLRATVYKSLQMDLFMMGTRNRVICMVKGFLVIPTVTNKWAKILTTRNKVNEY